MSKLWKNFSIKERKDYFLKNVEDCTFLVGMQAKEEPKKLKSHKFILCSVSPVFERMFNGDFKEAKSSEPVKITDAFACDFEAFLDVVHCEEPNASMVRWNKVYDIAKKYMADEIVKIVIKKPENTKNPVEMLQLYDITLKESGDFKCCVDKYLNASGILLCKAINLGSLDLSMYMSPENIQKLFDVIMYCQTNIEGGKLFQTIANLNGVFTAKEIKSMMKQFDFAAKMSFKDYFDKVENSTVVDDQFKLKILTGICHRYPDKLGI